MNDLMHTSNKHTCISTICLDGCDDGEREEGRQGGPPRCPNIQDDRGSWHRQPLLPGIHRSREYIGVIKYTLLVAHHLIYPFPEGHRQALIVYISSLTHREKEAQGKHRRVHFDGGLGNSLKPCKTDYQSVIILHINM